MSLGAVKNEAHRGIEIFPGSGPEKLWTWTFVFSDENHTSDRYGSPGLEVTNEFFLFAIGYCISGLLDDSISQLTWHVSLLRLCTVKD